MKKIIIRLVFVLTAGAMMSGPAYAVTQIDSNTIQAAVDRFVAQMQQETIKQNFAALLLKDEMRTKMMTERVPQKFMQSSVQPIVQPAMVEKVRAQMQAQIRKELIVR